MKRVEIMEKDKYLNEEKYQKAKKKIYRIGTIILVIGFLAGSYLIYSGIDKINSVNKKYSKENIEKEVERLNTEMNKEFEKLENRAVELETLLKPTNDKIKSLERVKFTGLNDAYYKRQDEIEELKNSIKKETKELNEINNCLENDFCYGSDKTENYYDLQKQLNSYKDKDYEFNMRREKNSAIAYIIPGAMVIFMSFTISLPFIIASKRREIMAFNMQTAMPVAKEGIEDFAPTIGNVAKEISKGINEGKKDYKE